MFTAIVMGLVIVWSIRNICRELGLVELARNKIQRKFKDDN